MRKSNVFTVVFSICLILIGISIFMPININLFLILIIIISVYLIYSLIEKEFLKALYLFCIVLILTNEAQYINLGFLSNIPWSISIIGVSLIYLGIKGILSVK